MSFENILNQVKHYQRKLEKYASLQETDKLLYCIHKLKYLPISVRHLEITGVGKSVNSLRHESGTVGEKVRSLINKWKSMVTLEEARENGEVNNGDREDPHSKTNPNINNDPEDCPASDDEDNLKINEDGNTDQSFETEQERGTQNGYDPLTSRQDYLSVHSNYDETYEPTSKDALKTISKEPQSSCNSDLVDSPTQSGIRKKDIDENSSHKHKKHNPKFSHDEKLDSSDNTSPSNKKACNENYKSSSSSPSKISDKVQHSSRHKHKSHKEAKDKTKETKSHHSSRESKDKTVHGDSSHPDRHNMAISNEIGKMAELKKLSSLPEGSYCVSPYEYKYDNSEDLVGSVSHVREKEDVAHHSTDKRIGSSHHSKAKHKSFHEKEKSKTSHRKESRKHSHDRHETLDREHKASHGKRKSSSHGKEKRKSSHSSDNHKSANSSSSKRSKTDRSNGDTLQMMQPSSGFADALMASEEKSSSKNVKKKRKATPIGAHKKTSSVNYDEVPSSLYDDEKLPDLPMVPLGESDEPTQLLTHYKPLPHLPPNRIADREISASSNEDGLNMMLITKHSNNRQRRIYTGKTSSCSTMVSLFEMCIRVLQENIDALEVTGGIPFDILRPVLERANPQQLFNLEDYNPYLLADSDCLWAVHCRKMFKNKQREDMESWRDLYIRSIDEHKEKMRSVTENLQRKYVTKAPPKRTTQLAFINTAAKPPKSVARAQAKYGTGKVYDAPAMKAARAVESLKSGMVRPASSSGVAVPPPRLDRPAPQVRPPAAKKLKVAPLMGKARQLMKKVCRR